MTRCLQLLVCSSCKEPSKISCEDSPALDRPTEISCAWCRKVNKVALPRYHHGKVKDLRVEKLIDHRQLKPDDVQRHQSPSGTEVAEALLLAHDGRGLAAVFMVPFPLPVAITVTDAQGAARRYQITSTGPQYVFYREIL